MGLEEFPGVQARGLPRRDWGAQLDGAGGGWKGAVKIGQNHRHLRLHGWGLGVGELNLEAMEVP